MRTLLADPAETIAQGGPRVIHNDEELAEYTEVLFKLTALEEPTRDQIEAINLLSLLVSSYEDEHYSLPKSTPERVVRYLMEQQGLKQRDLIPEFGNESAVSMFLSGQRELTVKQIIGLSQRFHLSAEVFLPRS
jgi:HTH-type transcriptional regulator / antitoxin HigA